MTSRTYTLRRSIREKRMHPFIAELVAEKVRAEIARRDNPPFHAEALQTLLGNLPNL